MSRTIIVLPLLLLASCASESAKRQDGNATTRPDRMAGAAPITHEPYGSEMREFQTFSPDAIKWKPGPPSLPAGAQVALLEGDPSKEGPFVFRLKFPDGYVIPPHMHARAERVTVIGGAFAIAEGTSVDMNPAKFRDMPQGSFGYWPARMPHYAVAHGVTILQLHGYGPWVIEYVNVQDDPRNAKRQ